MALVLWQDTATLGLRWHIPFKGHTVRYSQCHNSLQVKGSKSSVILFGQTPWCSWLTWNWQDALWDEKHLFTFGDAIWWEEHQGKKRSYSHDVYVWNINLSINIAVLILLFTNTALGQVNVKPLYHPNPNGQTQNSCQKQLKFHKIFNSKWERDFFKGFKSINLWVKWKLLASCFYPLYL